jgi:hypothetical protein
MNFSFWFITFPRLQVKPAKQAVINGGGGGRGAVRRGRKRLVSREGRVPITDSRTVPGIPRRVHLPTGPSGRTVHLPPNPAWTVD